MRQSAEYLSRRTRTLSAKVSHNELCQVLDAAQAKGKTISAWMRDVIIRAVAERDVQVVILEELLALRILTLNLLAGLHARVHLSSADIQELLERAVTEKRDLAQSYIQDIDAEQEDGHGAQLA